MILVTRQTLLSLLLRTCPAGFTRPAALDALYVGLLTTMPADDGSGAVEASGSGYARVARAPADANWSLSGDQIVNVADIQFPLLTGPLAEVVGYGIWDGDGTLRWAIPAGDLPINVVASAQDDTLARANHGFLDGQMLRVIALDGISLDSALAANTTYFVRDAATGTLKAAATAGGAAIDLAGNGACQIRRWYGKSYAVDDRPVIPAGGLKFKLTV
jgi:hypothetical protein